MALALDAAHAARTAWGPVRGAAPSFPLRQSATASGPVARPPPETRIAILHPIKTTVALCLLAAGGALAHGDVAPQAVDTSGLPPVGEEWLSENPYRTMGPEVFAKAISVGASGFNQNCARCHGLQAVSGGLAPDLRYLAAEEYGDSWFVERFQTGYTQNGVTKMPAFGELLGQEAAWTIRSYIETRPGDGALDKYGDALAGIRDMLGDLVRRDAGDGAIPDDAARDIADAVARLTEIADGIDTASGAAFADSAASRAASALRDKQDLRLAFEALTIGLSNAN